LTPGERGEIMPKPNERNGENGVGDIMGSAVGLGRAATKFTMAQIETALCAVSTPTRAINRIKRSLDSFAEAMNAPLEGREAPEAEEETARKPVKGEVGAEPAARSHCRKTAGQSAASMSGRKV